MKVSLPIVGDYRDLRARIRTEAIEWHVSLGGLLASLLGALAPAVPPVSVLLDHIPVAAVFVRTSFAVATFGLALHVLAGRRRVTPKGPALQREQPYCEYQYQQSIRVLAKFLIPPLLLLSIFRIYEVLPNHLLQRQMVSGFVCRGAEGAALAGARAVARSATGASVGEGIVGTDGFIIIDLAGWGLRPLTFDVMSTNCSGSIPIADRTEGTRCLRTEPFADRELSPMWHVTCK
jgi:hypothetical protein